MGRGNTAVFTIVALRNEKGSYNVDVAKDFFNGIVALRNEKGSYNLASNQCLELDIVALRNEKE